MARVAYPVVFVHLPRTGGITLGRIFDRQYGAEHVFKLYATARFDTSEALQKLDTMSAVERTRLKAIIGHQRFGMHRAYFPSATCVTMLREPVDRSVAYYYYILNNPGHYFHRTLVEKRLKLRDFMLNPQSIEFDNYQTRQLSDRTGVPIGACSGEMLDEARANLARCAVWGLTNRFDESILLMKRALGWSTPLYEKLNVGHGRVTVESIPEETVAAIRAANSLDIELYEFAREKFNQLVEAQGDSLLQELKRFRLQNSILGSVTNLIRRFSPNDTIWR
jgi:hypothetical protein